MKLFAIYIGGQAAGANIEIHDMRFVAAPSILETYDELRRQWWGVPGSLHIDCWAEIDHADGHDVVLATQPFAGPEKLFYVNLGGYDVAEFSELHRNMFVVAASARQAKARALQSVKQWTQAHEDDTYEAEQVIALEKAPGTPDLYVHLQPAALARPLAFTCGYTPIA